MSATGTRITKKSPAAKTTVEVASGTDGQTTISSLAAAREAKLGVARAAVALDTEQVAAVPVAKPKKTQGIPKALNLVPTPKTPKNAKKATAAAQVVKTAERVVPRAASCAASARPSSPLDYVADSRGQLPEPEVVLYAEGERPGAARYRDVERRGRDLNSRWASDP